MGAWFRAMGSARRKRPVGHGLNVYKRGLCRCDVCREANREHERKVRQRTQMPTMPFLYDTLTLSEFKKYRGYDTEEEGR